MFFRKYIDFLVREALKAQVEDHRREEAQRQNQEYELASAKARIVEQNLAAEKLERKFPVWSKVNYLGLDMIVRATFINSWDRECVRTEWVDATENFRTRDFYGEEIIHLKNVIEVGK